MGGLVVGALRAPAQARRVDRDRRLHLPGAARRQPQDPLAAGREAQAEGAASDRAAGAPPARSRRRASSRAACCCRARRRGVRVRLRAVLRVAACRSRALAVLFARVGAQRLAAAGRALGIRLRPGLLPRRRVVGVREPARLRRDARGARRASRPSLFCAYLALFPALAGWLARALRARSPAARLALRAGGVRRAASGCAAGSSPAFRGSTLGTSQAPASPLAGFAPRRGRVRHVARGRGARRRSSPRSSQRRAWSRARFALLGGASSRSSSWAGSRDCVEWTHARRRAGARWRSCRATSPQELKWRDEMRVADARATTAR